MNDIANKTELDLTPEKDNRKVIVAFKDVKKDYKNFKSNHQRVMFGLFGKDTRDTIHALKGVSFEIRKGEKVAIIGTATSGKTTTLRLMAGMIKPTEGIVRVKAEPTLIFDHKYGFKGELTGRENMRQRSYILGWPKGKLEAVEEEIIEFADLKGIIDNPVKTLPTGSMARISLGMMTAYKPELLLYDEYCNFGGKVYLPTCIERIKNALDEDATAVFTVGNYPFVKQFCTRGIVLDKGEYVFDGPIEDAMAYFRQNCKLDPVAAKEAKARERAELEEMEMGDEEAYGSDF